MIKPVLSSDGSFTAFSDKYQEHYHATRDGALNESINKHVQPALLTQNHKSHLDILDLCFGLGFNTFTTIYKIKKYYPDTRIKIISPELDEELVKSLNNFSYPKEFDEFKNIIDEVAKNSFYKDEQIEIKVVIGDARKFLENYDNSFDIIYQDAFSPKTTPQFWTKEYFKILFDMLKDDGVLTTYSTAFQTRLALFENQFEVYLNSGYGFRDSTVASKHRLRAFTKVDMQHKIECNPNVNSLSDSDYF